MKRLFIYLLCICVIFGLSVSAGAEKSNMESQPKATTQQAMSSQYIITVPDSVLIDKDGNGQISVVASGVDLPWSAQLSVQVSSNNYHNNS